MTTFQALITIFIIVLGTAITRFLPFLCFPSSEKTPKFVFYVGEVLPLAIIGFLVIYCLKGISLTSYPYGIPELISVICVVLIHLWKKSTLLSIISGTVLYMILIQVVF